MLQLETTSPAYGPATVPPPVASPIESLDLLSIVNHRECVQAGESVGEVYRSFEKHSEEYVAVLEGEKLLGLCSRGQIGFLLGARYGFAIYSAHPIKNHLLPGFLSVLRGTPCSNVLEAALSRARKEFYDDVALVDADDCFYGIITVETLVRLQSKLVNEKARQAEAHQRALEEVNKNLFRSLHQLHQSQGRYDILFENTALGVALLNSRGEVEATNRRLRALLERAPSAGDDAGIKFDDLIAENERARFHCRLLQHAHEESQSTPHSDEFKFILPRRGSRIFKVFFARIPATGQVCVLLDDISEQRLMERQMAQHEKSALLESLVGGIAHEINNRLSPIVGYTELMLAKAQYPDEHENLMAYCGTVRDNAMESAKIIRQLLQLSKPVTLELSCCDLQNSIQDAFSLTKFRLREAGVEFEFTPPAGESFKVLGDSSQIKQVIVNLILNASDAMEHSAGRRLTVSLSSGADTATISVQDTGHGIPPERIGRIFDPFFTTKAHNRGTGLGLSVCYSIVKQHRGEITVESEPNHGATFRVTLPLAETASSAATEDSGVAAASEESGFSGVRVLVVDDEQFIVGFVQEALRSRLGCQVEWAFNGQQAIELLKTNSYGLVISDIRMPHVNGVEFFDWIRANRPEAAERFFFITGDPGGNELNARVTQLGVPVLRKPFTLDALVAQSRAVLDG